MDDTGETGLLENIIVFRMFDRMKTTPEHDARVALVDELAGGRKMEKFLRQA